MCTKTVMKYANDYYREMMELKVDKLEYTVHRIYEILLKHNRNEDLSNMERFIVGLKYSEFYVSDDAYRTEDEYYHAEQLRGMALKRLGLTANDIFIKLKEIYNII